MKNSKPTQEVKPKNMFFVNGSQPDNSLEVVPSYKFKIPDDLVYYLYGEIIDAVEYTDMIHSIRYAEPDQQISMHINSEGGSLDTCLAIINAIMASQANVITIIDGQACSAAAMIWLAGHQKALASKHCFLMVHSASWAMYGKTSDHEVQTKIMKKIVNGLIKSFSSNLFKAEEIDDISKGVDIYLTGEEIAERCKLVSLDSKEDIVDPMP